MYTGKEDDRSLDCLLTTENYFGKEDETFKGTRKRRSGRRRGVEDNCRGLKRTLRLEGGKSPDTKSV